MKLPAEFFSADLTSAEFKTLVAMYHLADRRMRVDATTDELRIFTGYSPESLRKAFRGLEKAGLLETVRTKRNGGKLYYNRYQLVLPSHESVGSEVDLPHEIEGSKTDLPHESVGSTHGTVWLSGTNSNKLTSLKKNTTYSFVDAEGVHKMKEVPMEKWRPRGEDTSGDDSLAGFGLFEDDAPAQEKSKLSMNRRDARTRGRRPESEWTTYDVASEFVYQLSRRFPHIPGLVNSKAISGALRKYRSENGTNADIEMEILRMFFDDPRNWQTAPDNPTKIHTKFLAMFKTHMNKAYEHLDYTSDTFADDERPEESFVYASDGRKFDNSHIGRKRLAQYEAKLAEKETE